MKKFDDYQTFTETTAVYKYIKGSRATVEKLMYPVLGLSGESGEVAEKVKKLLRDKDGVMTKEDREAVALELGDVLWYVAQAAARLNIKLSDVVAMNIKKLRSRKARGKIRGSGDTR